MSSFEQLSGVVSNLECLRREWVEISKIQEWNRPALFSNVCYLGPTPPSPNRPFLVFVVMRGLTLEVRSVCSWASVVSRGGFLLADVIRPDGAAGVLGSLGDKAAAGKEIDEG